MNLTEFKEIKVENRPATHKITNEKIHKKVLYDINNVINSLICKKVLYLSIKYH